MKRNRIAFIACLALIVTGVFFATSHAEARVFVNPGSTGCSAPVGGNSIGDCGEREQGTTASPAPKHWHRHWHYHRHFRFHHFRPHHFHHHR